MVLHSIFFYVLAVVNGLTAWYGFRDGDVVLPALNLIVAIACIVAFCKETSS